MPTSVTRINNVPVSLVLRGDSIDGRKVASLRQERSHGVVTDYVVRWLDPTPPATSEETYYMPDARVTVIRRVSS